MDPAPIQLKVLMVRVIGGSEMEFTKDDIRSLANKTKGIQTSNTSHCAARKQGLKAISQDLPLEQWPADVVCFAGITQLLVDLHVILLVWDKIKVDTSDLGANVSVIYAYKSRKIDAWLSHLNATIVSAYDYVWLADGDVKISVVNWFAFWTHMLYFQPQIAQPGIVAFDKDQGKTDFWSKQMKKWYKKYGHNPTEVRGSDHEILRIPADDEAGTMNIDPSLIAADVGIIEIMAPVLTARAWLHFREELLRRPKAMEWIEKGATWCVDLKWCEWARTALGLEVAEPDVPIRRYQESLQGRAHGERLWGSREASACLVFYQTPVRHHNFRSLKKLTKAFDQKNSELCRELEVELRNTTLHRAYRAFYESDLRATSSFTGILTLQSSLLHSKQQNRQAVDAVVGSMEGLGPRIQHVQGISRFQVALKGPRSSRVRRCTCPGYSRANSNVKTSNEDMVLILRRQLVIGISLL
ncbi:unnamed protein product [Symbiodinium natans]|uniref:Uncharacterized protein n=1 Tax=Symbiodinium natans TaxID=878477 RepID=A0A812LBI0_9DINO|nr:unnamed protein product [Symbiodinium natans]